MVFDTLTEAESALRLLDAANLLPPSTAFVCQDVAELARLDLPAEDAAPYIHYLQRGRVVVGLRTPAVRQRLRAILEPAGAYAVRWWDGPGPRAAAPTRGAPRRPAAPAFVLGAGGSGDRDLHAVSPPLAGPRPPTETEFRSGGEASRAAQTPPP